MEVSNTQTQVPQSENQPAVRETPQALAIAAFKRRQVFKPKDREQRRLTRSFGEIEMSYTKAWFVAIEFAKKGQESCDQPDLRLVHAWLVMGEERYRIVVSVVRAITEAAKAGVVWLKNLISAIQKTLPTVPLEEIRSEVESVRVHFGDVQIID